MRLPVWMGIKLGSHGLEHFTQDLHYAARVLRKNPGFSATAVLMLALGIGANTALFGLLDALLLRSLPVPQPEQLVRLADGDRDTFGYPSFDEIRQGSHSFSGIIASQSTPTFRRIEEDGVPRPVILQAVSAAYFDVLGVSAWRGRLFGGADAASPEGAVAVISESYWRSRYGSDPSAIGKHFRHADRDFTIVGVAPPRFRGILLDASADIWVPFEQAEPLNSMLWTRGRWLYVMGRLRPGATAARAQAEATARLGRRIVVEGGGTGFSRLRDRLSGPLLVVQLVTVMVLLIACANLANLILARAASRDREIAIRQAVGASRARLVRQLLTESLLLSVVGGALALVVAQWLSDAVLGFLPPESSAALPNLAFYSNARVIGACAAISVATCLLFGLAPAFRATGPSSGAALKTRMETGGRDRRWTSRALVVCEVSLCVFLLIGAGLFVGSLRNLLAVDAGFAAKQIVVADVEFPREYEQATRTQRLEDLSKRAAMLPDVRAAGFSQIGQMSGLGIEGSVYVRAQVQRQGQVRSAFEQRVSPGFLAAMGTELLSGRDFDARDGATSAPVAIVNESFVRQFLPTGQPLGQRFGTDGPESSEHFEIVGVVVDSKWVDLRETRRPMYYRPFRQLPTAGATMVVRTSGRPEAVIGAISGIVQATDRRLALKNVAPFTEIVNRTLAIDRMVAHASAAFGLLALLIVCAGLFGVLAYGVARRTREIGVRMALGATPAALQWMVMRESLVMLAAGLPIGTVAALAGTRFVASMLFGLTPADPATIAGAVVLLTAVALAAAYVPARRATKVDPLTALRAE